MTTRGRAKSRRPLVPAETNDYGSPHREQHSGGVELLPVDRTARGAAVGWRARARCECRLDWYLLRGLLSPSDHRAGMYVRTLWLSAHGSPRVISGYGQSRGGSGGIEAQSERSQRYARLISGIPQEMRDVVVSVCGLDEWAGGSRRLALLRAGLQHVVRSA